MAQLYLRKKIALSKLTINPHEENKTNEMVDTTETTQYIKQNQINSGPYTWKIFFEDKPYEHSVNINKLKFIYNLDNIQKEKYIYLSTGHSFAEHKYETDRKSVV